MRRVVTTEASLTFLLVSLFVLLFVLYPVVEHDSPANFLLDIITSLVLFSGTYTVSDRRGLMILAAGLGAIALALHWLVYAIPGPEILLLRVVSLMLFLGVVTGAVLYKVLRRGPITIHRLQGAVAVYLMLGLLWASAYSLIMLYDPAAFDLGGVPERGPIEAGAVRTGRLVYFSFVTMTTLGYGDITPHSSAAQNLAILQALIGQLYLAVILARLVSLIVTERDRQ